MNRIKDEIINKVGEAAVKQDWELAFGGKSYGNRHLYRVNKIAKFLQSKEGGDLDIVLLGAWVHDVALAAGSDYEQDRVRTETSRFLQKFDELEEATKERVIQCAVEHESESGVTSIEAKIVHDADALDKCGPLGVVRHIWKMTNMLENRCLVDMSDLEKLETHLRNRKLSLQTKSAKIIAAKLGSLVELFFENKDRAMEYMNEISSLAWGGMIADSIVDVMHKKHDSKWTSFLMYQINCKYLENNL